MKKFLSILLIVILIFAALPLNAAANEEIYTYYIYENEAYITDVSVSLEGDVIVPDTLGGCPVVWIEESAFEYCRDITTLTLPASLECIRSYAFMNCESLTKIILPETLESIGLNAFIHCYDLQNIVMAKANDVFFTENGVLYEKYSDGSMKIVCYPAGKRDKEYTAPEQVIAVESAAFLSALVETVTLSDNVKYIFSGAFFGCENLKNVYLGKSLEIIREEAFKGCVSLETVTLPDSVTEIHHNAFENCEKLNKITYNGSPTRLGEDLFKGTVVFENDENYQNGIFYLGKCLITAKTNISGEITIKEGTVAIAEEAFMDCNKLEKINIPDTVEAIGECAFWGCSSLSSICIPDGVKKIENDTFFECTSLKDIDFGDGVTSIGKMAFASCSSIEKLVIPDSVVSIGENAFALCTGITDLIIGEGIITGLGGYSFVGCTSIENITIAKELDYIGDGTFNLCENIKHVYYRGSHSDKEMMYIGSNAYLTDALWFYNSCIGAKNHVAAGDSKTCYVCGALLSKRGDLNNDGEIDTTDLATLKLFLAGMSELDDLGRYGADFNEDGKIDTTDLAMLKLRLAGIE